MSVVSICDLPVLQYEGPLTFDIVEEAWQKFSEAILPEKEMRESLLEVDPIWSLVQEQSEENLSR